MNGTVPTPAGQFEDGDEILSEVLADEPSAAPPDTRFQTVLRRLLVSRNLAITAVGVAFFIFFSLTTPDTFLNADNLFNIMRNVSLVGIVAVGMTFLMIAGEIDLSVGSVFGFLTMVLGALVANNGVDPFVGTVLVIVLGGLV